MEMLALCEAIAMVTGVPPYTGPLMQSFDVFFIVCLANKI